MPPFIVYMVIRFICTDMFVADMVKETDSMVAVLFPPPLSSNQERKANVCLLVQRLINQI
jgi:hypothetical protein